MHRDSDDLPRIDVFPWWHPAADVGCRCCRRGAARSRLPPSQGSHRMDGGPGARAAGRLPDRPEGVVPAPRTVSRRDLLKLTACGGAGLELGKLLDVGELKAAAKGLKLADVQEFTTACNFCSCGCGMIASVRDGKLITLEGDFDHV